MSPHNLCFLNKISPKSSIPCKGKGVSVPCKGTGVLLRQQEEFLLNTKQRSLFSKTWALPANARQLSPTPSSALYPFRVQQKALTGYKGLRAPSANFFGVPRAVARVNWGSLRSKAAKQKDFSRSLASIDKFSYPLQLTKKLVGWQPFSNLLVLNSYLDEIPYKLENALQSYFPRKNSQLLFLSTSFRKAINSPNKSLMDNPLLSHEEDFLEILRQQEEPQRGREILPQHEKLVIEELKAEGAGVKTHRSLLYKSKNSWVSDASANYKSSEIENNETEKTLDLVKEMFLVPGKQNEQSETCLKKLHLFEIKKLLQNQLISLINSFPIDLVEKSKTIIEKDKQLHALQIEDLHDNVANTVNNSNLFEMNGGLLDVAKKILEVKRNALKKAMDPGVKGQYLPGVLCFAPKSLMNSQLRFTLSGYSRKPFTGYGIPLPLQGMELRNSERTPSYAFEESPLQDLELNCVNELNGTKKSVAEAYWDTEIQRLTQLLAYSTVANAGDVKGLNPLLLLNTLGFTFNNLSPLTNPPIFSSSENKINVVDKDINFDKNSRYMSGYSYPDIESNSLKAFLYPWLGKNKNLMSSHYHYLNDKPIALYLKNLESNHRATSIPFFQTPSFATLVPSKGKGLSANAQLEGKGVQQHKENLLLSHKEDFLEILRQQEEPQRGREILLQQKNERYSKRKYNVYPYGVDSSLIGKTLALLYSEGVSTQAKEKFCRNLEKNDPLGNNHYMDNIEIPYKKFNHYLAKFPGFSDPTQFFTTLPQIVCGNENLVNESSILGELNFVQQGRGTKKTKIDLLKNETEKKIENVNSVLQISDLQSEKITTSNIVDKSEINKKFIQKNGCNSRKVAYSGIVVRRNKKTKDFQPFKDPSFVKKRKELNFGTNLTNQRFVPFGIAGTNKSSIWGTLFLGPENPLTNRQCHFFGQKQLSTLDTKSLQRDYLRELGKEILTQSNSKGYTEFLPLRGTSIERTKILSLSKKVNSFFFKKRKYSYLLEPKDQWHLLFQEQLCSALEDCKKYPLSTIHSFEETNMAKLDSGRIKVSAPLIMARFPKKLVQFPSIHDAQCEAKGYVSLTPTGYKLEQGISWRPFCHLQRSFIYTPLKDNSLTHNKSSICSTKLGCEALPTVAREKIIPFASNKSSFTDSFNDSSMNFSRAVIREGIIPRVIATPMGVPRAMVRENNMFANSSATHAQCEAKGYSRKPFTLTGYKGTGVASGKVVPLPLQGMEDFEEILSATRELVQQEYPHYPLFTERFNEEINALPYLNKNSLFYSATDSPAVTNGTKLTNNSIPYKGKGIPFVPFECEAKPHNLQRVRSSSAALYPFRVQQKAPIPYKGSKAGSLQKGYGVVTQKNMKNNLLGVQNMCTSLLMQEPLNCNSWAVLNQWVFLIALLFWIEQTLLNHVFPALFALEQILLSAAGLRTGENNRTHVLRISKNETPKFQNLAGIDGLLGELSELVLFLREQRNLGVAKLSFWDKWNKKNSYGVLLTGSPGTGKTFLVRALANEANVPVLILSASTLTANKLNNNKPSWSIRHAFKRAKQLAPCILFIDEIDALGKSRGKIVTDINEIVADTNLASASHKRILSKSTHNNSASLQQMFSYEQFGQNSSNFNGTLFNKWEYPLQSTILQESNEINQNSLCQDKLVDLLKIAGGAPKELRKNSLPFAGYGTPKELGTTNSSGKESAAEFKESTSSDIDNKGVQQLPTLEKEMTRGKFGPLTQLLVSMDGVSSFSGVLIMGATNRPELLDPALTRPGRFEKTIRIDKPSEQNRIEILQLYSQNLGVQQQIPWSYLATRTIGLTTADLAVAMNYSSLRAIIQDSVHTLETIEHGLNCITRF